jgi:hypothetical protein
MDKLDNIIKKVLQEGDTYEKMAAKGKKAGNLKQGTVRKRLGIPKDEKIPLSKINKEISRLKKMDKDKDKKGVQLGDKNQKYYKALQLSKTLKTTTNVNEDKDYSKMHNVELNATYKNKLGVKDTKGLTRDDLIRGLKFHDASTKMFDGKKFDELDIAQKQKLLSYMNRDTEKEFERRMAMREEFKKGDKVTYLGNPGEITFVGKDQMDRTYYSVSYDKGRGKTKASNLYNKGGEIKAVKEDINDPVLVKTRAAQMKRDAIDKKDLENKSKRISAEKAIDLRYELSILNKEREDILMRIEDLGFETEQTAEPEGGKKADDVGKRMEIALKDLRDIDNKIIDIKDDLGVFDMNEIVNEEDRATRVDKMLSGEYEDEDYKDSKRYADVRADLEDEIDEEIETSLTSNEIGDELVGKEYASPAFESLYQSLKEKLNQRLGK